MCYLMSNLINQFDGYNIIDIVSLLFIKLTSLQIDFDIFFFF